MPLYWGLRWTTVSSSAITALVVLCCAENHSVYIYHEIFMFFLFKKMPNNVLTSQSFYSLIWVGAGARGVKCFSRQGGKSPKGHPGQRGWISVTGTFYHVLLQLLIILAQLKIKNLVHCCPPQAKGGRESHQLWPPCPAPLAKFINFDWGNLNIFINAPESIW